MGLPDVSVTWVISVSATVLLLTYFWFSRRNPKLPAFPLRAWPIVGNLLQLDPDPREQFARFRKQCGDIFSLQLGPTRLVVLNGLSVVKEVFIKREEDFADKSVMFMDIITGGANKGITSSSSSVWKEHRMFSKSVFRSLGIGRNVLAENIQIEVSHFMDLVKSFKGESVDMKSFTRISTSNIVCSIIAGQRYDYYDKEFHRILHILEFNTSKLKGTSFLNFFPWLRFLPGDFFCCKIIEKNFREFYKIFDVHINENEDVVGEPGNFISAYLQEMRKKEKSGERTYLDKTNLLRTILDLFIAGTYTTAGTILLFFLYMVNYPAVQERIFQEIQEVVGLNQPPGMQDKAKLIYLTATIMEVQRMDIIFPVIIPRVVSRDVNLRGYFIPKGTPITVNFESILHDPVVWGDDADSFRPDRFIAKDGSLISQEAWIPFSLGRRVCLGASLAKMELFLFVSNILQRFQILPPDPNAVPPVKGHFTIGHTAIPYTIRFVSRE